MAIGGVVINFVAKTADAIGDVGRLSRGLDDVDDSAGKADKSTGRMGKATAIAGGLALGAAGAIVGMAGALWEAGKGAFEEEQAYDKLAQTLGKIPGVTDAAIAKNKDWIGSMQLATGVAEDELTVAIGKATLATGDLTSAQDLVSAAIDAGTATGKAWSPIADAMAKAATGNTKALEKMFPWLEKGEDKTLTYAEAMKQLAGKFDGAAEAAADNDPYGRLSIIFGELKDAVGQALVPLINKFGEWMSDPKNQKRINDITEAVSKMATAMGEDAVDAIEDLMKWLKKPENQQALKDWAEGMANFASSIGGVIGKLETLYSWIQKLPSNWILKKLGVLPDFNANATTSTAGAPGAAGRSATATATSTAPVAAVNPPTVIVTEEQVYRAVSRLLLRGDARNGRTVLVG
jgi:hypothetical protein